MSWNKVLEEHTRLAVKLYPQEKITLLIQKSGIHIAPDGSNTAASEEDLNKYLRAVEEVLGQTAVVSAKLKMLNKKRTLGL